MDFRTVCCMVENFADTHGIAVDILSADRTVVVWDSDAPEHTTYGLSIDVDGGSVVCLCSDGMPLQGTRREASDAYDLMDRLEEFVE